MLRNKNGVTFVSVVGTAIFVTIIATLIFSFVGNNGLLVNKYASYNKIYSKTSDALTSAANYLVENSSGEEFSQDNICVLVNTKLNLPGNFGIDVLEKDNIQPVTKNDTTDIKYNGMQVKLTREGFYINVFLSEDGSQKSLSNIFFDSSISIDAIYKTGFLTAAYIYENGLYYNSNKESAQFGTDSPFKNSTLKTHKFYNAVNYPYATTKKDEIYNDLIPKGYKAPVYEYDEDNEVWKYNQDYIDNQLIDKSIELCMADSSKFLKSWDKTCTFSNQSTFIKGDVIFKNAGDSTSTFEIKDFCTVYISGDLNMEHTPFYEDSGQKVYSSTTLKLGKNATLIVQGKIRLINDVMMPTIECGEGANIIAGGDIEISGYQDLSKTKNSDIMKWYFDDKMKSNGRNFWVVLAYKAIYLFKGDEYFRSMANGIRGKLTGTLISGNDIIIGTYNKSDGEPPCMPVRATMYADGVINFGDAFLTFCDPDNNQNKTPSFLFAATVKFLGTGKKFNGDFFETLEQMGDATFDEWFNRQQSQYLFIIIDDDIEYHGASENVKANIFTTNIDNKTEVVKKISDAYSAFEKDNKTISAILGIVGVNQEIQNVLKTDVEVDASNLGLPKVLTEGSTDQSYSSNVRK